MESEQPGTACQALRPLTCRELQPVPATCKPKLLLAVWCVATQSKKLRAQLVTDALTQAHSSLHNPNLAHHACTCPLVSNNPHLRAQVQGHFLFAGTHAWRSSKSANSALARPSAHVVLNKDTGVLAFVCFASSASLSSSQYTGWSASACSGARLMPGVIDCASSSVGLNT